MTPYSAFIWRDPHLHAGAKTTFAFNRRFNRNLFFCVCFVLASNKEKELKEKDLQRTKFLEEMRKNRKLLVMEHAEKAKKKIDRTLSNNEEKLEELKKVNIIQ